MNHGNYTKADGSYPLKSGILSTIGTQTAPAAAEIQSNLAGVSEVTTHYLEGQISRLKAIIARLEGDESEESPAPRRSGILGAHRDNLDRLDHLADLITRLEAIVG